MSAIVLPAPAERGWVLHAPRGDVAGDLGLTPTRLARLQDEPDRVFATRAGRSVPLDARYRRFYGALNRGSPTQEESS